VLRGAQRRRWLGRAGASVLLAGAFNVCQLALVAWVLVGSGGYFGQIGPLLVWSVASALVVAWLSLPLGGGRGWEWMGAMVSDRESGSLPQGSLFRGVVAFALMAASLWISDLRGLGVLCVVAVAWGRRGALVAIARTWPFLPYLAWFHLRDTPGDLVWGTWITRQGVEQLSEQALRLAAFTAFGRILAVWFPWRRVVVGNAYWARGFAMVLPRMPHLFPASLGAARSWWKAGRKGGVEGFLGRFGRELSDRAT
ncbi:MAG TPA: hypothetical protein PKY05_08085, partial [Fibrobacteria bacterium]|nr:hypothetical protein [Fibrobacteria bacterium]